MGSDGLMITIIMLLALILCILCFPLGVVFLIVGVIKLLPLSKRKWLKVQGIVLDRYAVNSSSWSYKLGYMMNGIRYTVYSPATKRIFSPNETVDFFISLQNINVVKLSKSVSLSGVVFLLLGGFIVLVDLFFCFVGCYG